MANITNAEYANWVSRMNALRTKHGLSVTGCAAPGQNVVITAEKMNNLLSNMSMASRWLNDSITNRATQNAAIATSIQTAINNELTAWEAVCIHNTVFSANKSSNFSSNRTSNFSNNSSDTSFTSGCISDNSGNCSGNDGDCDFGGWCPNTSNSDNTNYSGNNGDESFYGDYSDNTNCSGNNANRAFNVVN